jgi:serine protease AprX
MNNSIYTQNATRIIVALLFLFLSPMVQAQKPLLYKYWVTFADKKNTPYSTSDPARFLSARALERRAKAGIAVVENDLPVDPAYVRGLIEAGARLHNTSRWLNAATVIADTSVAKKLAKLPFVRSVQSIGRDVSIKNPYNRRAKGRVKGSIYPRAEAKFGEMGYSLINNIQTQTFGLRGIGALGQGIWIAVMDGGFINTDTMPFFDSIAINRRMWPGPDFVERDQSVNESSFHGTSVLSVMAANLPGYFVGNAPEATYFLLKTEDTGGEFPVEEANWIAGAEWADSIGVNIINASLGYTTFTDTTLNHRYRDLDGRSSIGSRGATIAATKGMIICNSAGNSGDEPWRHIGVPADAPGVLAVGATGTQKPDLAAFSSVGPKADGRIKPDLVVPGDEIITAGRMGTELGVSSGTSLASPLLAGAMGALWSFYPEKTAAEITTAVLQSADQYDRPDNLRGYGLPNFINAWLYLSGISSRSAYGADGTFYSINPLYPTLTLIVLDLPAVPDALTLFDLSDRHLFTIPVASKGAQLLQLRADLPDNIPPGFYTAVLRKNGQDVFRLRIGL